MITLDIEAVDEIVDVRWHSRYRGHAFFVETVGPSTASLSLESNDPEVAEALSLDGHHRDRFSAVIPTSELRDVIEEITVRYKRGVPSL